MENRDDLQEKIATIKRSMEAHISVVQSHVLELDLMLEIIKSIDSMEDHAINTHENDLLVQTSITYVYSLAKDAILRIFDCATEGEIERWIN